MPCCKGKAVLAIDPGRSKCGVSLVVGGEMVWGEVMEVREAVRRAAQFWKKGRVELIALGDGTGSREILSRLGEEGLPRSAILLVPEGSSTLEGRRLYFRANPPRGSLGLLRRFLLLPPEPFDHYVAWALALRLKLTKGG